MITSNKAGVEFGFAPLFFASPVIFSALIVRGKNRRFLMKTIANGVIVIAVVVSALVEMTVERIKDKIYEFRMRHYIEVKR